jgi:hypothetical protein
MFAEDNVEANLRVPIPVCGATPVITVWDTRGEEVLIQEVNTLQPGHPVTTYVS